jgi:hypothetical protein
MYYGKGQILMFSFDKAESKFAYLTWTVEVAIYEGRIMQNNLDGSSSVISENFKIIPKPTLGNVPTVFD